MSTKELGERLAKAKEMMQGAEYRAKHGGPADCRDVAILALIRAVELLAGERAHEPSEKPAFDDGLVERLLGAFDLARDGHAGPESIRDGIRAILSELAAMPVEMPTADEVAQAWNREPSPVAPKVNVLELFRARLGPILAAKGARVMCLENDIKLAKARIAELEKRLDEQSTRESRLHVMLRNYDLPTEPKAFAAQYERERKAHDEHVAELETRLVERNLADKRMGERLWPILTDNDAEWAAKGETLEEAVERVVGERNELRNVARGAPVDATGKTPGQVNFEERMAKYGLDTQPSWADRTQDARDVDEAGAKAVIRAFGNVAEVLQRVRERFLDEGVSKHARTVEIIDDELAKLGGQTDAPTHVHELGSCSHCDKQAPVAMTTKCTICGCPNERAFLDPCIANGKHNFVAP